MPSVPVSSKTYQLLATAQAQEEDGRDLLGGASPPIGPPLFGASAHLRKQDSRTRRSLTPKIPIDFGTSSRQLSKSKDDEDGEDASDDGGDVCAHGPASYLQRSLSELFLGSRLNLLLVVTPFAFLSKALQWGDIPTFVFSLVALIPFAERVSFVTEDLAKYTNETVATFELRVGTDFLVVFSPDASDADADSDHSYLVHFDVDTGTVGKQAARVHQLKRVVVAAVTFPILLLSGITHDLIPFFYYSAMGQMPPCIVPSPNSCGIPCVNSVHGYTNVTSGEILELNVANRLTLDTATNYTLHALQHLSFWEPWNFVLYQFADMQCYITLYGLFASSLLTGLLIKKLVDLVRGVNATCQKLEDLHDLLLIYRWPASSNRAEINDGKLALLTFRLAKLRQPYQHTDLYKAYNMAEYPHISSRAEHPESDSGEGLTWWFLTRAAVLADLECFVRSMAFVLLVSILIVALLIVVTVYRGVTSGLEMPLTLYAIVDGLVFGVLMLILVMSGSTINDCISEGETLVQQIIDEASTEGRNTATMKALLDYYQHRPYRLKFFGLTVDRAFVTTYGGSLGAYGVVIMVNFAREYLVPWMKALE